MVLSLRTCSFCGVDFFQGQGITLFRNDGTSENFCSSKCRKNSIVLRRDPRKLKWAKSQKK
jgi:large subunit ribosomal protein L24e